MRKHAWTWLTSLTQRQNGRRAARSVTPRLESLEERCVPSTVDLTTAGSTGYINGAIFQQANPQPAGTGVIQSFLRVQSHGQGGAVEQGYNSDARPTQFDEKTNANFTHALPLSQLPVVSVGGVNYRVIMLDINQNQSSPLLSLDDLKFFVSDSNTLHGYDASTGQLGGQAAVYDMEAGGNNSVILNSALKPGSGAGDMLLYVPDSALSAAGPNANVYLYCKFGMQDAANGGFEEWAPATGVNLPPVNPPPPPATVSGYVYADVNGSGTFDQGESGLAGVTITLTGMTASGQAVTLTATTNTNGFYTFGNLAPGTYQLTETQPTGYAGVLDSVGTVNNVQDGTDLNNGMLGATGLIGSIQLINGNNGINYNFGEQPPPSAGS